MTENGIICCCRVGKIGREVEDTIDLKEKKIKDIYERQKSSKTKKSKLEVVRGCKTTITEKISDWRMTLVDAEEKNYKRR